jgi:hypothetical protein
MEEALMRRGVRLLTALGPFLALVTLTVVLPSQPAGADRAQCGQGQVCVWEHDDYQGCFAVLPPQDKDWRDGRPAWKDCQGTMNDKVSSYVNNSDSWVGFWENQNRRNGYALCVKPGASTPNISNLRQFDRRSFEDRITSHYIFDRKTWGDDEPAFFYPDGEGYCETYDRD